jgi:hypothetical protein
VKQWKSKEWYKHKSGFITGSIAQQSVNMQNSLDRGLERKVSSLVKKITCLQEKSPLSELVLTTFVHVVVKITALMLLWNINVLGSIDIFHLKKHFYLQEFGGEINGNTFTLKSGSRYYMQVQLEMFVTELDSCDFVVWTEHGILSVSIPYDETCMENALAKPERFWMHHVLPVMTNRLSNAHKGRKLIKIVYL